MDTISTEEQNPTPDDQRPVSFAIVSTAEIAKNKVIPGLLSVPFAALVGVSSRSREKAQAFVDEHCGGAPCMGMTHDEIFDGVVAPGTTAIPRIDALYVPLPSGVRNSYLKRALELGKHVYSEKPHGGTVNELRAVLDLAASKNLQWMDGTMWYHAHRTKEMEELLFPSSSDSSDNSDNPNILQRFSCKNTNRTNNFLRARKNESTMVKPMHFEHNHKSCLSLFNSFETDKLETTTLYVHHPGKTVRRGREILIEVPEKELERSCLVFSGQHGVEELFQVEEDFEDAIDDLELTDGQIDEYWVQVLAHRPRQNWKNMWSNMWGGTDRLRIGRNTKEQWKTALITFREFYAPSKRARDDVVDYLYSEAIRKPKWSSCQAHADRVETCCRRANLLHGYRSPLNDGEIKYILFKSFPKPWQNNYISYGRDYLTESIKQIVQYMTVQKGIADENEHTQSRKRAATDSKEHKGQKRKRRLTDEKKERRKKINAAPCRKHNGEHSWGDCPFNKRGNNNRANGRGGNPSNSDRSDASGNPKPLGKVRRVSASFTWGGGGLVDEAWKEGGNGRTDPLREPMGMLGDSGHYPVSAVLWAFGWELPTMATAVYTKRNRLGAIISVEAVLRFGDGGRAIVDASCELPHRSQFEIVCDNGILRVDDLVGGQGRSGDFGAYERPFVGASEYTLGDYAGRDTKASAEACDQVECLLRAFCGRVKAIERGGTADPEWSRRSLCTHTALCAIFESSMRGGVDVGIVRGNTDARATGYVIEGQTYGDLPTRDWNQATGGP